jgi:hypothetical protein
MIIQDILQAFWGFGAATCVICSIIYFRYVRLQRPPIGVFNMRDLLILLVCLIVMPFIYLALPPLILTVLLGLILMNILHLCLRPLLSASLTWISVLFLLIGNILATLTANTGWQPGVYIHWSLNDLTMLIVAVTTANLYVQCGMRVRYVAWFALFLACYDAFFAWIVPVTLLLANHFANNAFEPAFGLTIGIYQGYIGLGDLLTFALICTVMYKGFGFKGFIASFMAVFCFGILLPPYMLSIVANLIGHRGINIFPVQVLFGPVVFILSYWFCWHFKERSVRQWLEATQGSTT